MNINQLKRSSPTRIFNPRTILGSKLAAWWDCKTKTNLGFGTYPNVSQINDLSGNGKHATQGNGSIQPNYDSSKKCITFTLNDFFSTTLTLSGTYGIFVRCNNTKNDGNNSSLIAGSFTSQLAVAFIASSGYKFGGYAGKTVSDGSPQQNIVGVYGLEINPTTSDYIYIGANKYTVDAGDLGGDSICIGKSYFNFFEGDVYEIVVANKALTSSEVTSIIRYLNGVVI